MTGLSGEEPREQMGEAHDGSNHDSIALCELSHRLEALWCCGGLIADTSSELEQSDLWRAQRHEEIESIRQLQEFIGAAISDGNT